MSVLRLAVLVVAGCGRLGFSSSSGGEADAPNVEIDAANPADAALPAGLVLWVPFDGDPRRDAASGELGDCAACPTLTPGPVGDAGAYDGTTCLRFADQPSRRPPAFTIALWIQTDVQGAAMGKPYMGMDGLLNSWELFLPNSTRVTFGTTAGGIQDPVQRMGLTSGAWHHLAGTFAGTDKRLYVDGALVDERTVPADPIDYDAGNVMLGCDVDMGNEAGHVVGALDDVRLYDRALDAGEIAALAALAAT